MSAKEYLRQIERLDTCINQRCSELSALRSRNSSISAIDYSKDRVQSSINANTYNSIDRAIDLDREINQQIDEFVKLKHRVITEIQSIKNISYMNILYKRYVEYKPLSVIAYEMHYSEDTIKHKHGYALCAFEREVLNINTQ